MEDFKTCMICDIDLMETDKPDRLTTGLVVVSDAKCLGDVYDEGVYLFEEDRWGYRAVYCNQCWGSLVAYSWKKVREERGE